MNYTGYHTANIVTLNGRHSLVVWGGLHHRAPTTRLEVFDLENNIWRAGKCMCGLYYLDYLLIPSVVCTAFTSSLHQVLVLSSFLPCALSPLLITTFSFLFALYFPSPCSFYFFLHLSFSLFIFFLRAISRDGTEQKVWTFCNPSEINRHERTGKNSCSFYAEYLYLKLHFIFIGNTFITFPEISYDDFNFHSSLS